MGSVFARGFLRLGIPVVPVIRGMDLQMVSGDIPEPLMVLFAVAEKDFHSAMGLMPEVWKGKLALLQNELLPLDWQKYQVQNPTPMAVWFEKKKGQDVKVLLPTQVYGPRAQLIKDALATLDIPVNVLVSSEELEFELVNKNLFVFTINIAGLQVGGTTGELWIQNQDLALQVADEVLDIQEWLVRKKMPRSRLMERFAAALQSDPDHICRGRAAPDRLVRAITHAEAAGLKVPVLQHIKKNST